MKSFWFFIHSLLFLISNFSISQYIPPLPDPRDDLTRPSSLMAIKRQMFPNYIIPVNTSEIEENPLEFELHSPISGSQESLLSPQKIKANSPEAYNQNGVNFSSPLQKFESNPFTKGVVLVKNMSALRVLPGYYGLEDEEIKKSDRPSKYSKDPLPYYSPIVNGSEIVDLNKKDHIFAVPMELYDERNPYDPENEQLHLIRKAGLARYTPQTYYDPTYWPFYKRPDNINQTLMVAASRKNKPKSIKLEEFLKKRRNEEREKQLILRQRDLIDEYKIDKKKNWELMKQNDNERFGRWYNATESMLVSYPIKKSLRNPKKMDFKEKKILIKNRLKKQNKNKT